MPSAVLIISLPFPLLGKAIINRASISKFPPLASSNALAEIKLLFLRVISSFTLRVILPPSPLPKVEAAIEASSLIVKFPVSIIIEPASVQDKKLERMTGVGFD